MNPQRILNYHFSILVLSVLLQWAKTKLFGLTLKALSIVFWPQHATVFSKKCSKKQMYLPVHHQSGEKVSKELVNIVERL